MDLSYLSSNEFSSFLLPQLCLIEVYNLFTFTHFHLFQLDVIAGSLESANSSILAARRHFKEVVGKKIRILL